MVDTGLNATAAALLGLLHEGPMTGGQLAAAARDRLGAFWKMTRSQIYRELPVLADQGYVRAGKIGLRGAVPYHLTVKGRNAFRRWLDHDPSGEAQRNPVLLRVFFGDVYGAAKLRKLLADRREEDRERLAMLRDQIKEATADGDKYRKAALDCVLKQLESELRWLQSVRL
jgi:DNA-binding PadR family transcriptional regulator